MTSPNYVLDILFEYNIISKKPSMTDQFLYFYIPIIGKRLFLVVSAKA